jgi:hypothetical protein
MNFRPFPIPLLLSFLFYFTASAERTACMKKIMQMQQIAALASRSKLLSQISDWKGLLPLQRSSNDQHAYTTFWMHVRALQNQL